MREPIAASQTKHDLGERPAVAGPRPPRRGRGGWRLAWLAGFLALVAGRSGEGGTRYLAVFSDGRTLEVVGARLVDDARLALDLGDGAVVTVPLLRVERVIEAEVVEEEPVVAVPPCPTAFAPQPLPAELPFGNEILAASREANLHPWLVAAVVEAESAFNPWAVSRVGARGLMQLMPIVWLEQGVADPHGVAANLGAGCRHLKGLLDRFGDLALALAAYNAGAATVERAGGVPPYRETREFVRRVLAKFCPAGEGAGGAGARRGRR